MVKKDKRAANVHDGKVQINGALGNKHAPVVATVPDGDKLTNGHEEITETLPALPSKEEAGEEEEVKEEVFEVVAGRDGRGRTVAAETGKAMAAPAAVVTGTNMWALLSDDDPGNGGANQVKRAKKNKTKKKNEATVDCKEETPASESDEKMSEKEEEMSDEGLCPTVASFVFMAAATVAVLASMSIVLEIGYL